MKLCTISETAKILGYKSRSQLYRLLNDGWLDDYLKVRNGKRFLDLEPPGKLPLGLHLAQIVQWKPDGVATKQF